MEADEYDRQKNRTIMNFMRTITDSTGAVISDSYAQSQLASNYFRRLNVQRNMYSLGNGITFDDDTIKPRLGKDIDRVVKSAGYHSLIHGTSFVFWNNDRCHVFKLTEFAPLYDEFDGSLSAGVRFWRLDGESPLCATLYTPEGAQEYREIDKELKPIGRLKPYIRRVSMTQATGAAVVGESNYSRLPIVPMYGSELKQSTLIGMKRSIDDYDLIMSGFANDLLECAQIYWLLKGAGGMSEKDSAKFRDRLLRQHIAAVPSSDTIEVEPYTPEIPYQARQAHLELVRKQLYSDFGALDVANISAAAVTATQINAAYQPLDENADDFEYCVAECICGLLELQGITDAYPLFKRNRIANQQEETNMILSAAAYLDDETVLNKLPFVTDDEVSEIIERREAQDLARLASYGGELNVGNDARGDGADGGDQRDA